MRRHSHTRMWLAVVLLMVVGAGLVLRFLVPAAPGGMNREKLNQIEFPLKPTAVPPKPGVGGQVPSASPHSERSPLTSLPSGASSDRPSPVSVTLLPRDFVLRSWKSSIAVAHDVGSGADFSVADFEWALRRSFRGLVELLDELRPSLQDDPEAAFHSLETQTASFFDYQSFSRGVMGTYWGTATDEQRARFASVLLSELTDRLAIRFLETADYEVRPSEAPSRGGLHRAFAHVEIHSMDGTEHDMMVSGGLDNAGEWLVRYYTIDRSHLGLAFRNRFASSMRSTDDIEEVISEWERLKRLSHD